MDHVAVLQVNESLNELCDYVPGTILREALLTPKFLVEVSMFTVVENNVDVLGVVEVSMELDNVRVLESPLNLQFSLHLAKKVKLLQHVLEYDF